MHKRTTKLMTMHKALLLWDVIERVYVSRKEGDRGLSTIEESIGTSIWRLKNDIKVIGLSTSKRRTKRTIITWKQKWEEKQLYGYFKWQKSKLSHEKCKQWLRKGDLQRETESLLIAIENNSIRTNYIKAKLDCADRDQLINRNKQMQQINMKRYKTRHDLVRKVIHCE